MTVLHLSILLVFLCCQWVGASSIALFHALDEDLSALLESGATKVRSFSVGTTAVQQLALNGHAVYVVRMGSGCVQTCLSAQALLAKQKCDLVISVGPVGDIKGTLRTGTWYRVGQVVSWQRGSQDQTGFRLHPDARAEIPPAFDEGEAGRILKALPSVGVASGEVFIASDEFRRELASRTGCEAVDMNLFGLLAVLRSHGIAGVHLRTPSDRADARASEDFRKFTDAYEGEGGKLAAEIIRALPRDRTSPQAHEALHRLLNQPAPGESRPRIPQSGKGTDDSSDPDGSQDRSGR